LLSQQENRLTLKNRQGLAREDIDYLEDEISALDDPRTRGKALVGDKRGLFRYRAGDCRIICDIQDGHLIIAAIFIEHKKGIYL